MECKTTKKYTQAICNTLVLLIVSLMCSSCYYDNEEYIYGDNIECDTLGITYENFVADLMTLHCDACHNPGSPSGNIITSDYNDLLVIINNGKLHGAVNHLPGYSPMPKGGNKLPDCDISKLNSWLNDGYPQE
jgi:hypothetical protein